MKATTEQMVSIAMMYVACGALPACAEDDGPALVRRFREAYDQGDKATQLQVTGELFEHAKQGDPAFFEAVRAELRTVRQSSGRVLPPSGDALLTVMRDDPLLLEFAEDSLDDPDARADFLDRLAGIVNVRFWSERLGYTQGPVHSYPPERVTDFLVQAARHENERVRQAGLRALAGHLSFREVDGDMQVQWFEVRGGPIRWDAQVAIPILREYATEEGRPFEERQPYLEWLIALDAPGREQYVDEYRAYVLESKDQGQRLTEEQEVRGRGGLVQRLNRGERLKALGFVTEQELQPLRDEYEAFQEQIRIRTEGIEQVNSNGQ